MQIRGTELPKAAENERSTLLVVRQQKNAPYFVAVAPEIPQRQGVN